MTVNWPCDACGRSPSDVDELLHWPVLIEGCTLCPDCNDARAQVIRRGGLSQGGGFEPESQFDRLPEGF